ncbi:hypothetical protein OIDMADRAFT_17571 [Oidiodendron maius Zn]|uniref:Uncharacterized protein n=1 Tax=Oidiodendron maius (strain Zn) TaxID=913774 RepID=A0A0C3H8H5_OIDMZ|nr:hypothetical protein OIDMADRAFT_17571 [Oidiodendron maius Zn]
MPSNTTEIEARIDAASAAMDANPSLKASVAAHHNSRGGHNKKLNSVQDSALRDYIFMLYSCGTPANTEEVLLAANRLLYYSTGDPDNPEIKATICKAPCFVYSRGYRGLFYGL